MSFDALNEALKDRLEDWLPGVLGGGLAPHKGGRIWQAETTKRGGIGNSLEVIVLGAKRGTWIHRLNDRGGDCVGLIAYAMFADDMSKAFHYARDVILKGHVVELTPAEKKRRETLRQRAEAEQAEQRRKNTKSARRIWFYESSPQLLGTPVEFYFRDRGLELRRLRWLPGVLRYHPALYHPALKRELPAMTAAITNIKGWQTAVHRTWLIERNGGPGMPTMWDRVRPDLDDGAEGKLSLGEVKGGSVRLWPGLRPALIGDHHLIKGDTWDKAPEGSEVDLVEGIENGVALVLARPSRRVVVCVAIAGLANVELPPNLGRVTLCGDNDANNHQAQRALQRAVDRHRGEGRAVQVILPPPGIKDWNAFLQKRSA